jgi:hypothetical protein
MPLETIGRLMEADENDDEKESKLWCNPDSPFAALHKAKGANKKRTYKSYPSYHHITSVQFPCYHE